MGREGWIYAIAFLAILGVGAMIILPRLDRGPPVDDVPRERPYRFEPEEDVAPKEPGPAVATFEAPAAYPWFALEVRGPSGPLSGAFRTVHGARVEAGTPVDARVQRLRVQPLAPTVTFGAVGHQWVSLPVAALTDGMVVALPLAAPAIAVAVHEADGRAAPDVPVRVFPAPPGEAPRTNAKGVVLLDALAPGFAIIDLHSPERRGPRLRLRPGTQRRVKVVLEPAWEIVGTLLGADKNPIGGASVRAFGPRGEIGRPTTSAKDGTFRWVGPATARASLRLRTRGIAEQSVEVTPPAMGVTRTNLDTITLEGLGVTLAGTVQALRREPDAHVTVEPAVAAVIREIFGAGQVLDVPRRVPLEADGSFRLHDLPAHLPLRVSLRGAGVPMDLIVVGDAGETVPVAFEPPPGETLAGRVTLPDGSPAAGVALLVSQAARDGDRERAGDIAVVTGPDGAFLQHGFASRIVFVRAYRPGFRSLLQRVTLPLQAPLSLSFEPAVRDEERVVRGRVFQGVRARTLAKAGGDPRIGDKAEVNYGKPLAGVTVRAAGMVTHTDAEGRFRLEGVEGLASTVTLRYGYEPGEVPKGAVDPRLFEVPAALQVTPGVPPLDLVLAHRSSLRFRALDAIDDEPVRFLYVVVRGDDGRLLFDRGVATRDGVVELPDLPPTAAELSVFSHGRRFHRSPVPLEPGRNRDLGDILLAHGMRITGRVVDAGGRAIAGARVGAYGKGWQHAGSDPGAERALMFRFVRTDEQGRFVIEGFDPRQPADLAIWARHYAPAAKRVTLPKFSENINAEVEVKLVAGGYLAVELHEASARGGRGARVTGASLDLESARDGSDFLDLLHRGMLGGPVGSSFEWFAASDQFLTEFHDGPGHIVGPLRPGPYELWVERPGYLPLKQKLTVIDPKQTLLVDPLDHAKAKFRGHVTRYQGRVTRLFFELERRTP